MTNPGSNRIIVVLSLPRSGSSAIAGALHRMGVDMGEGHLQPPDLANPRGYYEDMRWNAIHKAVTGIRYGMREPAGLSQKHWQSYAHLVRICSRKPVWGIKSPRLCFVLHLLLPILQDACDVRLVRVRRDWEANMASLRWHSELAYRGRFKMTDDEAEVLLTEWQAALERRLEEFDGPVFEVNYDDLVNDPAATLTELETFCFKGMKKLSAGIERAVDWIDPSLRHEQGEPEPDLGPEAAIEIELGTGDTDGGDYDEDTDSDPQPETGDQDDAEGNGDSGEPERKG